MESRRNAVRPWLVAISPCLERDCRDRPREEWEIMVLFPFSNGAEGDGSHRLLALAESGGWMCKSGPGMGEGDHPPCTGAKRKEGRGNPHARQAQRASAETVQPLHIGGRRPLQAAAPGVAQKGRPQAVVSIGAGGPVRRGWRQVRWRNVKRIASFFSREDRHPRAETACGFGRSSKDRTVAARSAPVGRDAVCGLEVRLFARISGRTARPILARIGLILNRWTQRERRRRSNIPFAVRTWRSHHAFWRLRPNSGIRTIPTRIGSMNRSGHDDQFCSSRWNIGVMPRG